MNFDQQTIFVSETNKCFLNSLTKLHLGQSGSDGGKTTFCSIIQFSRHGGSMHRNTERTRCRVACVIFIFFYILLSNAVADARVERH